MLSVLISIAVFIIILSFLVIIHELGHFFAAKWAGVTAHEFGLGYPPRARKLFTWLGTDFTLNWIPFGGFVRMDGEEADPTKDTSKYKPGEFYAATIWQRLVVVLAGATVNFLFGVVAFAAIFSFMGIPQQIEDARVGFIAPESPAAEAGIPTDVNIIAFKADETVTAVGSPEEVIEYVTDHQGETVTVVTTGPCERLECQEKTQEFSAYLRTDEEIPANQGSLGVAFNPVVLQYYPWWQMPFRGAVYGVEQALMLGQEILNALSQLGSDLVQRGEVSQQLAGPVGIVHQAQQANILNQGFVMMLSFAGMLSINLAIMNVLPIPPLDGGKAVFTVLETLVTRKHLTRLEYWMSYSGYMLLMLLIIFVTIRDVIRIFS